MDTGTTIASLLVGLLVMLGGGFTLWLRRKRPEVSVAPPVAGAATHAAEAKAEAATVDAARVDRDAAHQEIEAVAKIADPNERRKALAEFAKRRVTGPSQMSPPRPKTPQ